jgi:HAD superfamily hydrolase (TIGR01509 family)
VTASVDAPPALGAALFDWDGTLSDSFTALLAAWHLSSEPVLGRRYPVTEIELDRVLTVPGNVIWADLTRDEAHYRELIAAFQLAYAQTSRHIHAYPGVGALLARLRDAGVPIAVITSKTRPRFVVDAATVGLDRLITVAMCAEETAPKPDPAPLHAALERLEVPCGRAVMIGDTIVDIAAGRAAGVRTIGVTWGHADGPALRAAGADVVVATASELQDRLLGAGWHERRSRAAGSRQDHQREIQ